MGLIKIDEASGILYRYWKPFSSKAALLLVHGLGGHSARWEFLADFFLREGVASYAIELKGFGETRDLKGHVDSFNIYLNDVCRLRDIIISENPGQRIFIIGESMGAVISFLAAGRWPRMFDGLICISPVFKSRLKFRPMDYLKIFSSLLYNPRRQFTVPFGSAMCTQDADYQTTMDKDPREHRMATSRLLVGIAIAQQRCAVLKRDIDIPVLFLLAGKDEFTELEASKKIFHGMKVKDKKLTEYPKMLHALSIELDRENVFRDLAEWIWARI